MLRNLARRTAALLSLVILTGCSTSTPDKVIALSPAITGKLCQSIKPIIFAKSDKAHLRKMNPKVAAVIFGNNEARLAWGCSPTTNEAA